MTCRPFAFVHKIWALLPLDGVVALEIVGVVRTRKRDCVCASFFTSGGLRSEASLSKELPARLLERPI